MKTKWKKHLSCLLSLSMLLTLFMAIDIHAEDKAAPPTPITLADGTKDSQYEASLTADLGKSVTWSVKASQPDASDPDIKQGLPDGITLEQAGKLTGTPTIVGKWQFVLTAALTAEDDTKQEKDYLYELTIKAKDVIPPVTAAAPQITTSALLSGEVGTAYSETLTATGTEALTWKIMKGSLPDGLTLVGNKITGIPTKDGTFPFMLEVSNTAGNDQKDFSITVDPKKAAPVITAETLPDGIVGTDYSADLTADGTAPITWKVKDDTSLPDGLTLDSSGKLNGTPAKAGAFPFTLTAENVAGEDSKDFTVTIAEAPVKPTITTASLPDATAGTAYSADLKADGTETITWVAKDNAALPDGITVDGSKLSGTPKNAGTYRFTLVAENGAGTAEKIFTLTVKEPAKQPEKKYGVTVANDGNGTAAADITSAAAGTKITLTAKPKDGWHFKEWKLIQGTVAIKDNAFIMPKENVTVKAVFEKNAFVYKVTKGGGQTHLIGDGNTLSFTCNGELNDLTGIYVDNNLVNSGYYTLKSDSTVLTLNTNYLDKLRVGTHTLKFKYGDNYAETTFKITAKTAAKTGDNTSVQIWLFTMGIALIAAIAVILSKRRHNR